MLPVVYVLASMEPLYYIVGMNERFMLYIAVSRAFICSPLRIGRKVAQQTRLWLGIVFLNVDFTSHEQIATVHVKEQSTFALY